MSHSLTCSVIWSDSDLLKVSASVRFGDWAGSEWAYVTRDELRRFADELDLVAEGRSRAALEAGQPDLSYVSLELFEYSRARQLGMRIHLGRDPTSISNHPAAGVEFRISVPIERGQLAAFAESIRNMISREAGVSALPLPPDWP